MRHLFAAALLAAAHLASAAAPDPALLAGLDARSIGPATMSGRVTAIEAVPDDPRVVYVGTAAGGVWKTTNAGITWTPVWEKEPVHSIGALAIDPSNPNTVWAGTGETNVRNSVSYGRGIYRSTDAGRSWQFKGLADSERIHKVVVDPRDGDVVHAAAMGRLWSAGGERGVYRTRDGGATWQRVLHVDGDTGAAELVMDPSNPNKLFAAMWQFRRSAHQFTSGGPGSGLYRSVDGGDTWAKLGPAEGLPAGELGKVAVAIAPSDPRIVYALVEAKESVLLRSTDGGYTFAPVNKDVNIATRPFYFSELRVDPEQPQRVYLLRVTLDVSNDGGKTFETLIGWDDLHPDHHAMWVHPTHGKLLINGNDGGVGFSYDRGETWRYAANLPLSQFYHVRFDLQTPYNLFGGLQDNGSWRGPAYTWEAGPVQNHHWIESHFGDGFDSMPDVENSDRGWALSQEGYLVYFDLVTGMRKLVRPAAAPGQAELRFHWNTALAQDPFDAATIYVGSQFVHRSTNRGDTWATSSPDLTTNDPAFQQSAKSGGVTPDVTGAENRTTLIAIAPSPTERGVIWAGSDDGRIHVTRDGGASWTSVEGRLRGAPRHAYVPHIHVSNHRTGTAFVVLDAHRDGDFETYVWRLDDYGARATRIDSEAFDGHALSVVEDPVEPRLVFVGTELGLFASFDAGATFARFNPGMPVSLSAIDLAIHPREHDLIVATHSRGIYVLDDIRALRAIARDGVPSALAAYDGQGFVRYTAQGADARFPGNSDFAGENRPGGAPLTFWIGADDVPHPDAERESARRMALKPDASAPQKPGDDKVRIVIRDAAGAVVRTQEIDPRQGLNRWWWDLRRNAVRSPLPPSPFGGPAGIEVLPGNYVATLAFRGATAKATLSVGFDPRVALDLEALKARDAALARAATLQDTLALGVARIAAARADIERLKAIAQARLDDRQRAEPATPIADADPLKAFGKTADEALKALDEADRGLWKDPKKTKGYLPDTDAFAQVGEAQWHLGSSYGAPTEAALRYLARAEATTQTALDAANAALAAQRSKVVEAAAAQGLALLPEEPALAVPR
ncbi:MAG: WD40/YVTN/BNR-like repeat-containing protein [Pseudomonadota bacterium]